MRFLCVSVLSVAVTLFVPPVAISKTMSKPLDGYECRMLNITAQQSMDFNFHVPVRSEPSESAPEVGWASAVIIVKTPAIAENGFLQMLFPNGKTVWIAASDTKAYRPVSDPSAKCQPEILPNGRIGFGAE